MKQLRNLDAFRRGTNPIVLAIGVFDGVHLGHRALLEQGRRSAAACAGQAWVLTFDPHPLKVLAPHRSPRLLTSTEHKITLLRREGLDGAVVMDFTPTLAHEEPEAFIARLALAIPSLEGVVVGENWRFGHRARGDSRLLRELAPQHGFAAHVVGPVNWNGQPVSSTRIRECIVAGDLASAGAMLGRPFSVMGRVVHGRKVGRTLGFPTANVEPDNEVLPPWGIYAACAEVRGGRHAGAVYLSSRNQPAGGRPVVEIHLFDTAPELYGESVEIAFIERLREDRSFDSPGMLQAQIGEDVAKARHILAAWFEQRPASPAARDPRA